MTAVQWIQHDAEDTIFPKFNGAWSSPHSIEAACAELSQVQGQGTVISIVITCCVAEVTQDRDGRSITLRARDNLNLSSVKLEAASVANVSSHDCADNSKASRMAPVGSSSRAIVSSSLSSLRGLRACLGGDTGAAVVRWMWDDVGLSTLRNLERLNPFRWTNWTSLEGAATDLEQYIGTQDAQRPVRLVVLPNMMSSFVTKTDNVTDAWMALRELLERHDSSERAWEPLPREHSFMSCAELISDDDQHVFEGLAPCGEIVISDPPPASRVKLTSRNPNKISHFGWLRELLEKITRGEASGTVQDLDKNPGTPLFVVAGACPNNFCGMQAVLFSNVATHIDFWWIKPQASDGSSLEQMTLDLHSTGPFKNTAGRSKQVYAPFADKFNRQPQGHGKLAFGVDEIGRAFIEENNVAGQRVRMLLYLVWQESWSTLLARKAFIEGKIFYQRCERAVDGHLTSSELRFYSRQYRIESGDITLAPWQDEEEIHTLLPPDDVQDMYAMTTSRHD
mmetsp:Transcript_53998/g.96706  ORF Transcript_53998/g.96706 Transcript_53998/m.96706 type:complete len:508 (+) Transcript_53998:106-1629(+)|eukprot:CAMPEP_0197695468 /NCGR_PEP_ID=MMETSP1338-20131121/115230_1 /TAXON_ID=43686 ORGANISM="Pelagodinium beii, Strain RCC1491" /NCGR_SAMPLE_ID=MMETSP1338 /ASSEMBLY_ACC=CAM_ASM_000754 /LENGTH=507 /DNA_ID=CAMNT_0043278445 /DNA_START=21 /DNA_END=1544 /DNA_ORIENTATION=-